MARKSKAPTAAQGPEKISSAVSVTVIDRDQKFPVPAPDPSVVDHMLDTSPALFAPFYLHIGHALASWQHVEKSLADLFSKVSTCSTEEISGAIFFSVRDFSDKLRMVHSAAKLTLDEKVAFKAWDELRKRAITASERRNEIAHFQPSLFIRKEESIHLDYIKISAHGELTVPESLAATTKEVRLVMRPNCGDKNFSAETLPPSKALGLSEILKIRKLFGALASDIEDFNKRLMTNGGASDLEGPDRGQSVQVQASSS